MTSESSLAVRPDDPRRLKLFTVIRLRRLALIGQTTAVLTVYYALQFPLPLLATLSVIGLSACLNLFLRFRYPRHFRLREMPATALLGFDIVQLAALLYLTGGLQNPFAFLFLAPALISATSLPPRSTQILGGLAILCSTCLAFWYQPLPWSETENFRLPAVYIAGVWFAIFLGLGFISVYAWRVAEEARQLSDALAATEFVLAREQHLSTIDGLAAAAAHELGTPLATIALVANEMDQLAKSDNPLKEDILILKQQVARCREILAKIASLGDESTGPLDTMSLHHLLEEITAPHHPFGGKISVQCGGSGQEPQCTRNAGILYGLGNLIDNAVDFANSQVIVTAAWTPKNVRICIKDDGPGFAAYVLSRLGEPYITTRKIGPNAPTNREHGGLGLGLFIAKTLLERSGAEFEANNGIQPGSGAIVTINWPRKAFEAGLGIYGQPKKQIPQFVP